MKKNINQKTGRLDRATKREREENINYFREFVKIINHFFPNIKKWLNEVEDPRHPSYIEYDVWLILMVRLFGASMGINSMRNITEKFNKSCCIENIRKIFGDYTIEELPHYDTINNFLSELPIKELVKLRNKLIVRLIKMKCFNSYKVKKNWLVSIDGTGLYMFKYKHCKHCLTKTFNRGESDEYTLYFHYVLEAKLTIDDMVFSIAHEFIENPETKEFDEKMKQDCELKAFYRLEKNLKKEYPHLPICLLLDSLYANQTVFELCKKNKWDYIIRFKDGSLSSVAKEFESIFKYDGNITNKTINNNNCTYKYVNKIDYQGHSINVIEYIETAINKAEKPKIFKFITSTNMALTKNNQEDIVNNGRKRWEIENNGFNEQKNHGYNLTHTFSFNYTAMKNHYILIQIAHMLRQLFEVGFKILKEHKKSLANISADLLEAFRTKFLSPEDLVYIELRCQVRLFDFC